MWTDAELAVIGIVPVTMDMTNFKDKEYYINTDITYTYDIPSGKATGSYGTATAISLNDTGSGENLVRGLKYKHKEKINLEASNRLSPTDWMVIRATEGGTAVPSDITTKRAAVRTKANEMCTQINAASDVDALAALYVYNDAETPVRPIGELPEV